MQRYEISQLLQETPTNIFLFLMITSTKALDSLIENRIQRRRTIRASKNTRKTFGNFKISKFRAKRGLNNLLCFCLLNFNLTFTQSIFGFSKRSQIRLFSAFSLGLSLGKTDASLKGFLLKVTKGIDRKTISISLSGLCKVLFMLCPKGSDLSLFLVNVRNCICFSECGFDFGNFSLELLRKGIRFSGGADKLEHRVSILNAFSLGKRLNLLRVHQFDVSVRSLDSLHLGDTGHHGRHTGLNSRTGIKLVRTLRG